MSLRFSTEAAQAYRDAIREADGVEVLAIGDVTDGEVVAITVTCRGREDQVNALLDRPKPGQVVIHNHPSGDLRPSQADMQLAGLYGDDGVGSVIVDSAVTRSNWVVEPHAPKLVPVKDDDLVRFFTESLPAILPDAEQRGEQLAMARDVAACLNEAQPLVVEAGTGTGKSLAYLVPAALWALGNESKVMISTYTRALQAQLHTSDLPLLVRAGLDVRTAVLQGRNNYLCKRRLGLSRAEEEDGNEEDRQALDDLIAWARTTSDGARSDLAEPPPPGLWERVESDSDLTLRVRCEHYATCFYYQARRRAAGAHLVVVNHALLLADRMLRAVGAQGVLPKYDRVVLDEAHHLEDAATGAIAQRLTVRAIQRASAPLLSRKKKRGALNRLVRAHAATGSALPEDEWAALHEHAAAAAAHLTALRQAAPPLLEELAGQALDPNGTPRRIRAEDEDTPLWNEVLLPLVGDLTQYLDRATGGLDKVLGLFDDRPLPPDRAQPVFDVRRGRRRLAGHAAIARAFLEEDDNTCRWLEPARDRGNVHAALVHAPIDVAPTLQKVLWHELPGTAATSATMTVGARFEHWMHRAGLREPAATALYASPFDHEHQALLALPRDLPPPDAPHYLEATARSIVQAIDCSDGGAFVLCTSYEAVRYYAAVLERTLGPDRPLLVQRGTGRGHLLARFRDNPRSVLVATDSFWEGVSVKGEGLRLVIIPRLPFRVPTDPLQQARHERIARRGGDAFRTYTLPQAVLKVRQGYGRLIRSKTDRGVVLILDRRLHDRQYGALILRSLPPAQRVTGPWRRIHEALVEFFAAP